MSQKQITTFYINNQLYGIDVQLIQEITKPMKLTKVPLAPTYIAGLMNLRGQIATTIDLRVLFGLEAFPADGVSEGNNVICRDENLLLSLLVDEAGDVIEVDDSKYEATPDTVNGKIRQFMSGVYKIDDDLLSVLELKKIAQFLNK